MSLRAWSAFAAMSFLWGIPYLFIKVAVDDGVPPVFVAWARVVMAAAVLLLLAWRAGTLDSVRGHKRWIVAFAIGEIAIPFPLISAGEVHVDSSLAAIVIASVPLIVALLAVAFAPAERAGGARLAGLLIGFAGVVVLVGIDLTGSTEELIGALAILGAAVGYAVGPMLLRAKLSELDGRAVMGTSLAIAALVLTPLTLVDLPSEAPSASAPLSLVVLGLVFPVAAFIIYGALVAEVGAGRAVVITYVAPVVALALGVAVLGESPGPGAIVGLLLILAGSWLSTDGRLPPGLAAVAARVQGRRGREGAVAADRALRAEAPGP
jgi:drug/metabolite transporter (DMT)-like permease